MMLRPSVVMEIIGWKHGVEMSKRHIFQLLSGGDCDNVIPSL
jgi:hypothetical protein